MADREILVADFIDLKAKVKAEMLRRDGNGSVVEYGGEAYDYENEPAVGELIRKEHPEKNLIPLQAVNPTGLPEQISEIALEEEIDAMETLISALEAQTDGATSNNDCAAACTGMCVSECTGSCTGNCTGSCSGACTATCANDCSGGCGAVCTEGCTIGCGGCDGSCSGCGNGCAFSSCSGACQNDCTGSCQFWTTS